MESNVVESVLVFNDVIIFLLIEDFQLHVQLFQVGLSEDLMKIENMKTKQ